VWITAAGMSGIVFTMRFLGWLQVAELAAYDQLFRLRPPEPTDDRIVIVTIDDDDINKLEDWPMTDEKMANLLEILRSYEPRAIGLDIYRDLPVGEGNAALVDVFNSTPNLIGIEKLADKVSIGVQPPEQLLEQDQIGFNNIVLDPDGRVRRSLLFWTVQGQPRESFALKLASLYLEHQGIEPESSPEGYLQLGNTVFPMLGAHDASYVNPDTGGYQILVNFRGSAHSFHRVSLRQVLAGEADPSLFRDRIVLIGSTANSLQDFVLTPYSGDNVSKIDLMSGVELHANFISQILSAVLDGRSLLQGWPEPLEWVWIVGWAVFGSSVSWMLRSPLRISMVVLASTGGLMVTAYAAFLAGWWIPVVPCLITLYGSAIAITGYLAHLEEELQKSKEFLYSVINTIPDPVFVKDRQHRWIVLNEAYSRFVGYPVEELLEKNEFDVLPQEQAQHFWEQENLIFHSGEQNEIEEQITDMRGYTYHIATKRSLHKDSAGNVLLVGVMRDITQRKRIESELRRTTEELARSNAELKQAGDNLRQMAYHDVLTGLPNRKLLEDQLRTALIATRTHHKLVAVLFLDLDGFKLINDSYGHKIGDLLLQAVANRLIGCLRASDTVARLGGDEFVVVLPGMPDPKSVVIVAEKILKTLSTNFALEDKIIQLTTSIGVSLYPLDTEEEDLLLIQADGAMYRAKECGKNRYAFSEAVEATYLQNHEAPHNLEPDKSLVDQQND
jgi:diguanylate cyclase (GGDEF)-like protein/PAS domain S-box-containing protein